MKYLLILPFLFAFLSCKKQSFESPENITNNATVQNSKLTNRSLSRGNSTYLLYQISDQNLKNEMDLFIENFRNNLDETQRPSPCGRLLDQTSIITNIYHTGSFCDNSATVYITYRIIGIEWSVNSGSFSFSSIIASTSTIPNSIVQQPDIDLSTQLNPYRAKVYDVQYVVDGSVYLLDAGSTNTMTRVACSTPEVLSSYTSFTLPNTWYTTQPAIIYIFPQANGQLRVANQCNVLLCTPPYITECPNAGTFKYRIVGTNNWTTANMDLNFYANGLSGLTPGASYEYECVLTYSSGPTLPNIGTFTMP